MSEAACRRKQRYSSELSARMGAQAAITGLRNAARLWVYRCRYCLRWHLTSNAEINAGSVPVSSRDLYDRTMA